MSIRTFDSTSLQAKGSNHCGCLHPWLGSQVGTLHTPSDLALTTSLGPGLYVSPVSITQSADILTRSSLIPYPPSQAPSNDRPGFARKATDKDFSPPTPLGGAVTDWHWLLLYQDQLIGISRESEKEVYRERLPLVSVHHSSGVKLDGFVERE